MTASFHLKFMSQDTIYTWRMETHILLGPPDNVKLSGQALRHLITETWLMMSTRVSVPICVSVAPLR